MLFARYVVTDSKRIQLFIIREVIKEIICICGNENNET